ncbi:phage protein [Solibacillus silvestris]
MSAQFGRVAEFLCNGRTFSSNDFRIEFRVDFDDDPTSNTSEVTIYNLSDSTISTLKKNTKVTLNAGYKNDKGVIMSGYISKVITERDGTDHPTTIHVIDSQAPSSDKTTNKTYKKGVKASFILKDLAKILGMKVSVLQLPNDRAYTRGYYINGSIMDVMKAMSKDCGSNLYINKGNLHISPKGPAKSGGSAATFTLSSDTGLIGSPQPFEEETDDKKGRKGFKVKSLLQYRINTASTIQLNSKHVSGRYTVTKGVHSWQGNNFYTEVEVE